MRSSQCNNSLHTCDNLSAKITRLQLLLTTSNQSGNIEGADAESSPLPPVSDEAGDEAWSAS